MSIWDINRIQNKLEERKPETPTTPQPHIIDADGSLADLTTKFNTLLAQLEAAGILSAAPAS